MVAEFLAHARGIRARSTATRTDLFTAIQAGNQSLNFEIIAVDPGVPGDRHLATSLQGGIQRALGRERITREYVFQRSEQGFHPGIPTATFNPDDALAYRRQHLVHLEALGDVGGKAQPPQTGSRQHDAVVFSALELVEARVHIATQIPQ